MHLFIHNIIYILCNVYMYIRTVCAQCLECRLPDPPLLVSLLLSFFFFPPSFHILLLCCIICAWHVFFSVRSRGPFLNVSFSFRNHFGERFPSVDSPRRQYHYDDDRFNIITNVIIFENNIICTR